MKPWIKRSLFGLIGVGIVLGGLGAYHHYRWHDRGAMQGGERAERFQHRMVERASDHLDLTAAQRQLLVVLGESVRTQRQALIGTTTQPRAEMAALVAGPRFDRARAQAIVDEKIGAIRGKAPEVLDAAAAFYDSLDPQQQQQLRDHIGKRHRWFGHG